jgi:hypothetical protein
MLGPIGGKVLGEEVEGVPEGSFQVAEWEVEGVGVATDF